MTTNQNPTPVTPTAEDAQEVAAVPLPCPFCGHAGLLGFSEGSTFRWLVAACEGCGASAGETRIQTLGEGATAEWRAQAQRDAIAEWNKRAPVAVATSDAEDYAPPVDLPNAVVDAVAHHANYWPLTHGAIGKSFYRFAQELKNEVIARLPPHCFTKPTPAVLPIDFKQATELLAMFGGEPGEVTLLTGEGRSGRGLYAHYSEYPEEGAEFLGVADDEAVPGKQTTDQGGWQLVPKQPTRAMLDAVMVDEVESPEFLSLIRDQYAEDYCAMLAAAPTLLGVADGDAAIPSGGRDQ